MKFRREDFALKYFTDIQETKLKKKKSYTGCFGGCFFQKLLKQSCWLSLCK